MKNKFFKRFIGTIEDRDEYQLKEIYKELAFSGILLWYLTLLLMFISLIVDTIHNTLNFLTIALLIVNMIYAINVTSNLRKKRLDDTDCVNIEEYKDKKKAIKEIINNRRYNVGNLYAGFYAVFTTFFILWNNRHKLVESVDMGNWRFSI